MAIDNSAQKIISIIGILLVAILTKCDFSDKPKVVNQPYVTPQHQKQNNPIVYDNQPTYRERSFGQDHSGPSEKSNYYSCQSDCLQGRSGCMSPCRAFGSPGCSKQCDAEYQSCLRGC